MHKFRFFLPVYLFLLIFVTCKVEKLSPLGNDKTAPQEVTGIQVENLAGAAKLTYVLPNDQDLLYVKVEYEIRKGVRREVQSSEYSDNILIDGFGEAKEYEVTLYAVDRSGNKSQPVTVKVNPLTPPVQEAYKSLKLIADFGGVNLTYQNKTGADLVVTLLYKDSLGNWSTHDTFYSKVTSGNFSGRNFKSVETQFGVIFKDKFDNRSDTAKYILTPLFEEEIDKTKFKVYPLLTDNLGGWSPATNTLDHIWDENYTSLYHTAPGSGFPQWTTFDMGVQVQLSRFKEFPRLGNSYIYNLGNLKRFEIWGISSTPPSNGSWDGWVKLMDCQSIKPSGLPLGQVNNDDVAFATAGEDYKLPDGTPPVRYIRIKSLETWGKVDYVFIAEMSFWGKVIK